MSRDRSYRKDSSLILGNLGLGWPTESSLTEVGAKPLNPTPSERSRCLGCPVRYGSSLESRGACLENTAVGSFNREHSHADWAQGWGECLSLERGDLMVLATQKN